MARGKVNKAANIREELEKNPEARPKDVIAALLARKIKVSSAQVSNIRSGLNGNANKAHKTNGHIALSDLIAAKKLVATLGSIEKASSAIAALAKLQ